MANMQNYPNLPLHFLEHSICDGFRVTYPICDTKFREKNASASAGLPRTAANLHYRIFMEPPYRDIGSSRCVEGEVQEFAVKRRPTCRSGAKNMVFMLVYRRNVSTIGSNPKC
jgi:hypothetical protein